MSEQLRAVSAGTKHPNTPESDLLPEVEHEVTLSDGSTRTVMAACPMDAINKVNLTLLPKNFARALTKAGMIGYEREQ
jgi:hypothetical protein